MPCVVLSERGYFVRVPQKELIVHCVTVQAVKGSKCYLGLKMKMRLKKAASASCVVVAT